MQYLHVTKTNMLMSFMYKWNLFITSMFDCFKFIAEYAFWIVVYNTGTSSEMYGYTLDSMITYYIAMYIVGSITSMGNVGYKVAGDIKEGGLSNILIKPFNCLKYYFYESLGQRIPQLLCSLIFFVPIIIVIHKRVVFTCDLITIGSFIIALILAVILTYAINLLIGLSAFWLMEISGLFFMKEIIVDLLSGKTFPIDIMPSKVFAVLNVLPFSYCTYFPISILINKKSGTQIGMGIMFQSAWVIITLLLVCIVWKRGIKRYEGTGM